MKLVQSTTITESTPVKSMTCKLCSAQYDITLADLNYDSKIQHLMFWRCDTCGECNPFNDTEAEKKLAILCKIRAKNKEKWQRDD